MRAVVMGGGVGTAVYFWHRSDYAWRHTDGRVRWQGVFTALVVLGTVTTCVWTVLGGPDPAPASRHVSECEDGDCAEQWKYSDWYRREVKRETGQDLPP